LHITVPQITTQIPGWVEEENYRLNEPFLLSNEGEIACKRIKFLFANVKKIITEIKNRIDSALWAGFVIPYHPPPQKCERDFLKPVRAQKIE